MITPSIDPFSTKNCPMTAAQIDAAVCQAGLVEGDADPHALAFTHRDGIVWAASAGTPAFFSTVRP